MLLTQKENRMDNDLTPESVPTSAATAKSDLETLKSFTWKDFFKFERMLTPIIAKYFFMFWCAFSVFLTFIGLIGCLVMMVQGAVLYGLLSGLVMILLLPVWLIISRLWFETAIIFFSINEAVLDIRAKK